MEEKVQKRSNVAYIFFSTHIPVSLIIILFVVVIVRHTAGTHSCVRIVMPTLVFILFFFFFHSIAPTSLPNAFSHAYTPCVYCIIIQDLKSMPYHRLSGVYLHRPSVNNYVTPDPTQPRGIRNRYFIYYYLFFFFSQQLSVQSFIMLIIPRLNATHGRARLIIYTVAVRCAVI